MSRWDTEERPDWIIVLDEQCKATSQGRVATKLKYSSSAIGQIRKGIYRGAYDRVELAVRGAFMSGKVDCPALGTIAAQLCVSHMRNARTPLLSNSHRVRMLKACRDCPRFTRETE